MDYNINGSNNYKLVLLIIIMLPLITADAAIRPGNVMHYIKKRFVV